eukprot:13476895-Heterocapsa_arctica.AAC.1
MRLMKFDELVEGGLPPRRERGCGSRHQGVRDGPSGWLRLRPSGRMAASGCSSRLAYRVRNFARSEEVPVTGDNQAELQGPLRGTSDVSRNGSCACQHVFTTDSKIVDVP